MCTNPRRCGSGDIVVPTSAVWDEGTSYHYLPGGREAQPSPAAVEACAAM